MDRLKSLLLIKEGEGRQVGFYLLLFLCLGTGIAIGKGSADALFLKRIGIEYLPLMYLILSVVLAVTSTAYALFVDRIPPEKFFYILLSLQLVALAVFWLVMIYTDSESIFPAYFLLYEIVSELMLVHGAFYMFRFYQFAGNGRSRMNRLPSWSR